jgi:hypothetical protein
MQSCKSPDDCVVTLLSKERSERKKNLTAFLWFSEFTPRIALLTKFMGTEMRELAAWFPELQNYKSPNFVRSCINACAINTHIPLH